jgi:hypothetical protein
VEKFLTCRSKTSIGRGGTGTSLWLGGLPRIISGGTGTSKGGYRFGKW